MYTEWVGAVADTLYMLSVLVQAVADILCMLSVFVLLPTLYVCMLSVLVLLLFLSSLPLVSLCALTAVFAPWWDQSGLRGTIAA